MEIGLVELVGVAAGSGVTTTLATVAAMRADLRNLKRLVDTISIRLDRVENVATEARHRVDLVEARRGRA